MLFRPLHSNEYETLVTLLKEARKEAGLTQVEVAARLGVEQSFVSKVERRERRLDVTELRAFCAVLGIGLSEFVSRFEAALSPPKQRTRDGE
jgi:transcriptional regulator with XRE-family HTH domain